MASDLLLNVSCGFLKRRPCEIFAKTNKVLYLNYTNIAG
jgi:hypothetical protein